VSEAGRSSPKRRPRIFRDLADPQGVNRREGCGWKAPLGKALTDAGLTLGMGAGGGMAAPARELADGFAILGVAGACGQRCRRRKRLSRRMAARARRLERARGAMSVAARRDGRQDHAERRRHIERQARGVTFAKRQASGRVGGRVGCAGRDGPPAA